MIRIALLVGLVLLAQSMIPEIRAGLSIETANQLLGETLGPLIQQKILETQTNFTINETQTISGIKVQANLSDFKVQRLEIKWSDNVLTPKTEYNFSTFCRNINMSISTHVSGKIPARKINTTAILSITQVDMTIDMGFVALAQKTGVGFGIHINHIQMDLRQIEIMFLNDTIDTNLATLVIALVKKSIPTILNKQLQSKINPAIDSLMSSRAFIDFQLGKYLYTVDINTTEIPRIVNKTFFSGALDLFITNLQTLKTNPEIENDNLPVKVFKQVHEAQLIISSSFVKSVIWLVEDSEVIDVVVNNETLGDASPLPLDTSGLVILLPKIQQYGKGKGVYLRVTGSTKTPQMYIRSGRFIVSVSVNLQFIVHVGESKYPLANITQCFQNNECQSAAKLNTSVIVSVALRTNEHNELFGNVQIVKISNINRLESSKIDVDVDSLKSILNTLVGSFIPPVNSLLKDGIPIPMDALKGFNITNIQLKTELDYMAAGLTLEIV